MNKINWNSSKDPDVLYFDDLEVNESFRIVSPYSQGAVYTKVLATDIDEFYSCELATGKLWEPTKSQVERVNVEISIEAVKPRIYN